MNQAGGDTPRGRLGRRGENIAAAFLARAGYDIIERNWRCARGEIDIIARRGRDLVFVEVKTRSGMGYGHPFESITACKLARLRLVSRAWCLAHPDIRGTSRLDAIAVVLPRNEPYTLEHLIGVGA